MRDVVPAFEPPVSQCYHNRRLHLEPAHEIATANAVGRHSQLDSRHQGVTQDLSGGPDCHQSEPADGLGAADRRMLSWSPTASPIQGFCFSSSLQFATILMTGPVPGRALLIRNR